MPSNVTAYYVLFECGAGLEDESRVFGDVVHEYNAAEAIPRDVLFVPIGWENGIESPRGMLREDFRKIDYCLILLWDHLPSGAREKYELALKCEADPQMPMRQVVPFFKAVAERQLQDPGEKLKQLLDFKDRLAAERERRFESFATVEEFSLCLRRQLSSWLVDHERPERVAEPIPLPEDVVAPDTTIEGLPPPPSEETPEGLNQLGLLMQRSDRLDEAEQLHRKALERGFPFDAMAIAYGNLGVILRWKRKFDEAEAMFRKALTLSNQLDRPIGVAASYVGLGMVHRQSGQPDKAEQMFHSALRVEMRMNRPEGMVCCYRHLEALAEERNRSEEAARFRALSEAERAEPEYPCGDLFPSRI